MLNKEKITLLLSLGFLVLSVLRAVGALGEGQTVEVSFEEPAGATSMETSKTVTLDWFKFDVPESTLRNPFQPVSTWKSAQPDAMPMPPVPTMSRRVPLPGPVSESKNARPARETEVPEQKEEES